MIDALSFYRIGHWCAQRRVPLAPRIAHGLGLVLFNAAISVTAEIGEGTRLAHRGLGVAINEESVIGRDCMINHGVTVGCRGKSPVLPVIGDNVFLGAGAQVLGPVRVGDGAVIGANAVVIEDVPARCVAVGVPARVVREDVDVDDYADMPAALRAAGRDREHAAAPPLGDRLPPA